MAEKKSVGCRKSFMIKRRDYKLFNQRLFKASIRWWSEEFRIFFCCKSVFCSFYSCFSNFLNESTEWLDLVCLSFSLNLNITFEYFSWASFPNLQLHRLAFFVLPFLLLWLPSCLSHFTKMEAKSNMGPRAKQVHNFLCFFPYSSEGPFSSKNMLVWPLPSVTREREIWEGEEKWDERERERGREPLLVVLGNVIF